MVMITMMMIMIMMTIMMMIMIMIMIMMMIISDYIMSILFRFQQDQCKHLVHHCAHPGGGGPGQGPLAGEY